MYKNWWILTKCLMIWLRNKNWPKMDEIGLNWTKNSQKCSRYTKSWPELIKIDQKLTTILELPDLKNYQVLHAFIVAKSKGSWCTRARVSSIQRLYFCSQEFWAVGSECPLCKKKRDRFCLVDCSTAIKMRKIFSS